MNKKNLMLLALLSISAHIFSSKLTEQQLKLKQLRSQVQGDKTIRLGDKTNNFPLGLYSLRPSEWSKKIIAGNENIQSLEQLIHAELALESDLTILPERIATDLALKTMSGSAQAEKQASAEALKKTAKSKKLDPTRLATFAATVTTSAKTNSISPSIGVSRKFVPAKEFNKGEDSAKGKQIDKKQFSSELAATLNRQPAGKTSPIVVKRVAEQQSVLIQKESEKDFPEALIRPKIAVKRKAPALRFSDPTKSS